MLSWYMLALEIAANQSDTFSSRCKGRKSYKCSQQETNYKNEHRLCEIPIRFGTECCEILCIHDYNKKWPMEEQGWT